MWFEEMKAGSPKAGDETDSRCEGEQRGRGGGGRERRGETGKEEEWGITRRTWR